MFLLGTFELRIADEIDLTFDGSTRVMKNGRTTGKTEGILASENDSVCIRNTRVDGKYWIFESCYSIKSLSESPFFKGGDSGSGVFLTGENSECNKALGIAFASGNEKTYVCKISEIVEAFNIEVFQEEEPMDLS